MLLPAVGRLVLCEIVTAMSAKSAAVVDASTSVVAVAWLFAGLLSGVLLETEFVSVIR